MTHKTIFLLAAMSFALSAGSLSAGQHVEHADDHKMVIALTTDDFELAETDVSNLEIGDAKTIYTESGKTVDLLRTAEGIEVYIDGELLDTGLHGSEGLHGEHHFIHADIEVECDSEEECEEIVWITEDEDMDFGAHHDDQHHERVIIIRETKETN